MPRPRHRSSEKRDSKPGRPPGRLSSRQRRLAEQYLGLAIAIARRHQERCHCLWDDLEEAAMVGLVQAAGRYRSGDEIGQWVSYARTRIDGECREVIRSRARRGTPESLPVDMEGDDAGAGATELAAEEELLERIPQPYRDLVRLIVFRRWSIPEYARHSRITYRQAWSRWDKVRYYLQANWWEIGLDRAIGEPPGEWCGAVADEAADE